MSRTTETSHRVQGRGQDKDKRRTRPGHRAGPQTQSSGARPRQDKRRTRRGQGPATEDKRRTRPGHRAQPQPSHRVQRRKRRTRPGHRAQPQRTRGGQSLDAEPSHKGQGVETEQSPATEDKRRTRPGYRAQPQQTRGGDRTEQPQRTRGGQGLDTEPSHGAQSQSSGGVASSFVSRKNPSSKLFGENHGQR